MGVAVMIVTSHRHVRTGLVLAAGAALIGFACTHPDEASTSESAQVSSGHPVEPPAEPAPGRVALRVPDRQTIPEGPLGDAIRRGEQIASHTYEELPDHVGNGLHCTSCHLQGGTVANAGPWVGLAAVFPEFRSRSARVNTLEMRINDCFERSLNGTALDPTGVEMAAIVAYITWLSREVPIGHEVEGRGFRRIASPPAPDRERGRALYVERCAVCHGEDGAGRQQPDGSYQFPALWGPRSFNLGAGMARLNTAAAYVRWNMPLGQGGSLSDQQAYDVADYFIHQDRPDFARKAEDWPAGDRPPDARY